MPAENFSTCCLEIEFTLKAGKRREFTRSLEELTCPQGEGHLKTTVFEDREEPGHMIWIAIWTSRESVETYLRTKHFGVLIGGIKVLSTETSCRLVDEVQPVGQASSRERRMPDEGRFTLIDLTEFEGTKQ